MVTKGRFPIYTTLDKHSKALPQPFSVNELITDVMKTEPEFPAKEYQDVRQVVWSWSNNRKNQKTLFAVGQGKGKRFSWDPSDAKKAPPEAKHIVASNGTVQIDVTMPSNVESMVISVYGRKFEIRRLPG